MPEKVTPLQIQHAARNGFDRLNTYRNARASFVKRYVGQYYQKKYGFTGDQPINLLFNAIRIMVPNLVMKNPVHQVSTSFVEHRSYADLLGRGIDFTSEQINLKETLRAWIVDALFGFGIMKTTLNSSQHTVTIDDMEIDPGQVCSDIVSIDEFTFDPTCTRYLFKDAMFVGHSSTIPRQQLLDTNGYDHDLVKKLPAIYNLTEQKESKDISDRMRYGKEFASIRELVKVVELYIPQANALVTIPDPRVTTFDKYIRTVEYYGPDSGPYTYLAFTPPVPDNPLPIAPVSMWYDLDTSANDMFKKLLDQAMRQKDIIFYQPSEADAAQDALEARDGEAIAATDPSAISVQSFGGQRQSNEGMMTSIQTWFSYMAGNIEQLGGTRSSAATATQAEILQANANVTIEDSRDIIYTKTSEVGAKIGWYLFTDPLIDLPIPYRTSDDEVTIHLTPEERRGDFFNYTFKIKAKSMTRMDPTIKTQRLIEFATNIIPAAANAAMISMKMGTPFNYPAFVTMIAEELGLEDSISEVFQDPEFMEKMQIMMLMGPQNSKSKAGGPATVAGTQQNGGFPMQSNIASPEQQTNMDRQEIPAISQAARGGIY